MIHFSLVFRVVDKSFVFFQSIFQLHPNLSPPLCKGIGRRKTILKKPKNEWKWSSLRALLVPVDLCFTKLIRFSLFSFFESFSLSLSSFVKFKEEKLIMFIIFRVIASRREGRDEVKKRSQKMRVSMYRNTFGCVQFLVVAWRSKVQEERNYWKKLKRGKSMEGCKNNSNYEFEVVFVEFPDSVYL